ncbi:hypothetical protein GH714_018611 [Hevea brasiliensis]|uniref:Leucine-rich repeat-containing N-terminal plant-type domain-containing protein n=1 Tax=Hevea brasiliensis TaxID=3981 RepID=A0A6A6N5I8_HEVBR|nr:hypothetical protein GH714_018611 [Hevea brasiliensis]
MLKDGFDASLDCFSTWVPEEDCCKWKGVGCTNETGHFITHDLHSPDSSRLLQGELRDSLLDLPYLSHLDLSHNDFYQTQIPEFIGSLPNLKYLNLSRANFRGTIPNHLGNLSSLQTLDLSNNHSSLRASSLVWLAGLSSLKVLDLSILTHTSTFDGAPSSEACVGIDGLALEIIVTSESSSGVQALNVHCRESEQRALLMLKDGFHTSLDRFSSWVPEEDCCKWKGVGCNNETGNVISLDLHSPDSTELLQGELRDSLLHLPYLSHLDLSHNDFYQTVIPEFIGSLSNLKYLNLSHSNFRGTIPYHLGNLSSLQTLDLSNNQSSLRASRLNWLSGLSSLKVLDLSSVYLGDVVNWLDAVNMLPSLAELRLVSCQLRNLPQSLPSLNFSSLEVLDLSYNGFYHSLIPNWLVEVKNSLRLLNLTTCWLQGSIPHTIVNFTSLVVLDFSYNNITGSIPHGFGNMTSLAVLDLSLNDLEGSLPATLGLIQESHHFKYSPLREIRLSNNLLLNGSLERILPQLSELIVLDVAWNDLDGVITEAHLQDFSRLRVLDLSFNSSSVAAWNVRCRESEQKALLTLKDGFHSPLDRFSSWVAEEDCCKWKGVGCNNETGHVISLDLHSPDSSEVLQGELRDSLVHLPYLSHLDLSYNDFYQTQILKFIGSLSDLKYLNLSHANFKGNIPCHLGNLSALQYLDSSTGKGFPLKASNLDWLSGLSSLKVLDLSAIYLSDVVNWLEAINMLPSSVELRLVSCQLHNLPQSLPSLNFSSLEIFDLSYNSFCSMIPNWLVEVRHTLRLLNLTTCWLQGSIPHTIVNFTPLAVLDFSYNNLTGFIPPHDFGNMTSLVVLDFSYNNLKGSIPHDFGNMLSLSVLDLSSNYLEGPLPATLV